MGFLHTKNVEWFLKNSTTFVILQIYKRILKIISWKVGIPFTRLILPHFCACPKPGPQFQLSYVMVFFVFSDWRLEVNLLLEETGSTHRPATSHWLTLSHYVVLNTGFKLTTLVVIGTDCTGSCKSNYHTITTMTAPLTLVELLTITFFL
jgi:hypothetical protein